MGDHAPGNGHLLGRPDDSQRLEDWYRPYEEVEIEIEENVDLGNGTVFAVVRQRARPVGSDAFVEFRFASITEWTDGLIARVTSYTDIDDARVAAERLAASRE